jgi:hypothetical protein
MSPAIQLATSILFFVLYLIGTIGLAMAIVLGIEKFFPGREDKPTSPL